MGCLGASGSVVFGVFLWLDLLVIGCGLEFASFRLSSCGFRCCVRFYLVLLVALCLLAVVVDCCRLVVGLLGLGLSALLFTRDLGLLNCGGLL